VRLAIEKSTSESPTMLSGSTPRGNASRLTIGCEEATLGTPNVTLPAKNVQGVIAEKTNNA
jgi:hypothetical protein